MVNPDKEKVRTVRKLSRYSITRDRLSYIRHPYGREQTNKMVGFRGASTAVTERDGGRCDTRLARLKVTQAVEAQDRVTVRAVHDPLNLLKKNSAKEYIGVSQMPDGRR